MATVGLERRFEKFVADLFRTEGFEVTEEPQVVHGRRADLLIRSSTGATAVVEIKFYRSRVIPIALLVQAATLLENARGSLSATRSILVIGTRATPLGRETLKQQFPDLVIYDLDALSFLAAKYPHLLKELEELTREAFAFSDTEEPVPSPTDIETDLSAPSHAPPITPRAPPPEKKGDAICRQIHDIPTGKADAKKFEEKALEALQYIFDRDLTAWSPQKPTQSGLSIYDAIARVISDNDFWKTVVNQFRSRYIIFEFKNYARKIKQGQIYTTEKYLFLTALRSTAIIISRNGADRNAEAASRGALREHGKLMINLSISDLCKMLELKDNGDDPNTVLLDRLDDMLMRLER